MISSGTGGFSLAAGADFFAADLAGAFSAFSGVLEAVFFAGAFFAAGFAVFLYLSRMTSTRMNLSQAWTKALGVFFLAYPDDVHPPLAQAYGEGREVAVRAHEDVAVALPV